MQAAIHFFSGTGNTARAVGIVAARLEAAGWEVARRAIAGGAAPPAGIPDLTVVAFPIWAWAPPHFVVEYVRRLPKAQGARAAVLATCGGFGAQGVGETERALRRRGYAVVASGEAVYPDTFLLAVNPPTGTRRKLKKKQPRKPCGTPCTVDSNLNFDYRRTNTCRTILKWQTYSRLC